MIFWGGGGRGATVFDPGPSSSSMMMMMISITELNDEPLYSQQHEVERSANIWCFVRRGEIHVEDNKL